MAENCPFNIEPLDIAKSIHKSPIYHVNYTAQDFFSLRSRMLDIIKKNFGDTFNDFSESSIAVMLIEMWAFIADTLSFKIDQLANELFIDTVTDFDNMFRLARLIGFKPTPPLPAKAMFTATINHPQTSEIVLGTPITLSIPQLKGFDKYFELFAADNDNNPIFGEDIVIPAGKTHVNSIVGIQGSSYTQSTTSSGLSSQMLPLEYDYIQFGSIKVTVDNILWDEVDYFTESKPKMEYRIEYNSSYKAYILFGDNKAGMIPPQGAKIKVKYRMGGGSSGNIITGAFDEAVYANVPGLGNPLSVMVRNYTRGEFGYDGDDINDIRIKLPGYLRSQSRAVTGDDYKNLVDQFKTSYNGIVGKSTVVLRNHGCAGNVIDCYVLSKEGDNDLVKANDNLKRELLEYLGERKMFTDHMCVKDGEIVDVDVHADIYLERHHRKFEELIKDKIEKRLTAFFKIDNWSYGRTLRETDIVKHLSDIQEVNHFDITFTTTQALESGEGSNNMVTVKYYQIINLDNLSLSFNYKAPGEA